MSVQNYKLKARRLVKMGKRIYRNAKLVIQDSKNVIRFGRSAPRFSETIWVYPLDCDQYLALAVFREKLGLTRQQARARVITLPWPEECVQPITDLKLFENCFQHWVKGLSWEETGEYDRMEKLIREDPRGISHGCRNRVDIIRRYENLDRIFEMARREGRLRTSAEINPVHDWTAREMLVHVGPAGRLYKGGEGMHRFAIAYILKIPFPAQFGCVHISAIPYLDALRNNHKSKLYTCLGGQCSD